jgi:hypothetical protein
MGEGVPATTRVTSFCWHRRGAAAAAARASYCPPTNDVHPNFTQSVLHHAAELGPDRTVTMKMLINGSQNRWVG